LCIQCGATLVPSKTPPLRARTYSIASARSKRRNRDLGEPPQRGVLPFLFAERQERLRGSLVGACQTRRFQPHRQCRKQRGTRGLNIARFVASPSPCRTMSESARVNFFRPKSASRRRQLLAQALLPFDLISSHVSAAHREIITRGPASHGPRQAGVKGIHTADEVVGERGLACQ